MKTSISSILFLGLSTLFCSNEVQSQDIKIKQIEVPSKKVRSLLHFNGEGLSLYGAMSLNQQSINDKGITAPINYVFDVVNSNNYKPGYTGGFRIDGIYKEKHHYTFSIAVNRVVAGNRYVHKYSISPFMEDFTHFKADNKFTTINIATHYKKLLPVNNMHKYKLYAIAGPSLDYKISTISNEQLLNSAGNRFFINADLGAEFDNKGYYVLYVHYKLGSNLFNSSAPIHMNRFELGMSIKAKDLF